MPKPTREKLLTTALLARGYEIDRATRVTRYVVFMPHPNTRSLVKPAIYDASHRVYVGKMGALRISRSGAVAASIPVSTNTLERLLTEGRFGGLDAYEAWLATQNEATP